MAKGKKELPLQAEKVKRSGAGLASTTRGRARTFVDQKKRADKRACRNKGRGDD